MSTAYAIRTQPQGGDYQYRNRDGPIVPLVILGELGFLYRAFIASFQVDALTRCISPDHSSCSGIHLPQQNRNRIYPTSISVYKYISAQFGPGS